MADLLLRRVEVDGQIVDVLASGPRIAAIGPSLVPPADAHMVDGEGGALLPGLHDHHLHLLATAAARLSVVVGPPEVRDRAGLAQALERADASEAPGRWLRAVGYHESVAGPLDREALDQLVPRRPLRLQHRSGAEWVLNTAALHALDLDRADAPGAERAADGRLTGRFHRADAWMRDRIPGFGPPDLAPLGAALAAHGVTGVTDATPFEAPEDLVVLADAASSGALPQHVVVMGGTPLLDVPVPAPLAQGPLKLVIDDADYPALEQLVADVAAGHQRGRAVAIHCVTRTSLVLALAAWDQTGSQPGDRIEHGAVIPPELLPAIVRLGLTVVTQPGFVAERGDQYLTDVDPDDLPHLYPCRRLLDAAIPVAGSTDAPYTDIDPWRAMRAAVSRRTASGRSLAAGEAVTAEGSLQLFLGDPGAPGGPGRRVAVGEPSDLCLLAVPLRIALRDLTSDHVVATIRGGTVLPSMPR